MALLPSGIPQALADEVCEAVKATLAAPTWIDPATEDEVANALPGFCKGGIKRRHFPEIGKPGTKPVCTVSAILYRTEGRISLVESGRCVVGIYYELEKLGNLDIAEDEASLFSLLWYTISVINANGGLMHGEPAHPTVQGYATWEMMRPMVAATETSQTVLCGVEADFRLAATLTGMRIGG